MSWPSRLRIGLVYPELLGTYGDRGNAVVLAQRAAWRDMQVELVEVEAGSPVPGSLDVYVLGGGEDDPQVLAAAGLRAARQTVEGAWTGGAVVLAVCAGFQLIGEAYHTGAGATIDGLGLVDVVTRAGKSRLVGEAMVDPSAAGPTVGDIARVASLASVTGFENHAGRTTLGPGVRPFGRVLTGGGNGDGSGMDGVLAERLVGTYLHGPVLARNPELADALLSWVVGGLPPLESDLEQLLHDERVHDASLRGWRRWLRDRKPRAVSPEPSSEAWLERPGREAAESGKALSPRRRSAGCA